MAHIHHVSSPPPDVPDTLFILFCSRLERKKFTFAVFLFWFGVDADRATSISLIGGGQHLSSSSHIGGNGNNSDASSASSFYLDNFAPHRHQVDNNNGIGLSFSSVYPMPIGQELQPQIRLQSPPHRLNHRNRNVLQGQQYESGTVPRVIALM